MGDQGDGSGRPLCEDRFFEMAYAVYKIQNTSELSGDKPDIVITKGDPEWDEAFEAWKQWKNPTDSKLWKKGVFACTDVTLR